MSTRKKARLPRLPRLQLTHFEVRRGTRLQLRIAIADDTLAAVGDELGALFVKIAPSAVTTRTIAPGAEPAVARPSVIEVVSDPPSTAAEIVIATEHSNDDVPYHASLRDRFAEMFGSLCDASLADALEIAREERARRADGGN